MTSFTCERVVGRDERGVIKRGHLTRGTSSSIKTRGKEERDAVPRWHCGRYHQMK